MRPIQKSLEKQKTFVENASHELRTPLAVIQNRLESLFRKPESTILDNSENIAYSLDEVRNMRLSLIKSLPIMLRLLKKVKRGLLLKIRLGAQSKLIRLY